jgi:RimJ/RimL family protein N-acetyltransferase
MEHSMLISDHDTLIRVKQNEDAASRLSIPIVSTEGVVLGSLECLDRSLCQDDGIIADLTDWRQRYMHCFLTQFTATPERTRTWLTQRILPAPDRILFLIRDAGGDYIGNIGLCEITSASAEVDNVLRGKSSDNKNIMYHALMGIIGFALQTKTITDICLHVFSNNQNAINLYERAGFQKTSSEQLTKIKTEDGFTFKFTDATQSNVDFDYQKMIFDNQNLHT